MSLLFSGAPGHKLPVRDFDALEVKRSRLAIETAQGVMKLYQSRKPSVPVPGAPFSEVIG
jgi:hypothetical protein